jgi:hypothetical protein
MDDSTSREILSAIQDAIKQVGPVVLAARVRDALKVDRTDAIKRCAVRLVCLVPSKDRLLGSRSLRAFNRAPQKVEVLTISAPHLLLQCAPKAAVAAITNLGLIDDLGAG